LTHPSHNTRLSDSSLYDEVCSACGATDANGMADLSRPCPATCTPPEGIVALKQKLDEIESRLWAPIL
jgi:hypothetical protein